MPAAKPISKQMCLAAMNRPKPNNSGTGPNTSSPILTKPTPSSNNKIN